MRRKNRSSKTYYCLNCGKTISRSSGLYGSGLCRFCSIKASNYTQFGKDNPNWKGKEALTRKKYFCIKCDKEIKYNAWKYGTRKCGSCAGKFRKFSKETLKKLSKVHKGKKRPPFSEKWKRNISEGNKGKYLTEIHKQSIRESLRKKWKNSSYREKTLKAMHEGRKLKPNKPEKALNRLIGRLLPKEYKFVGDGKVILGGFNPDFINVNGQKKIIELYGNYWHNRIDWKERDKRRIKTYKKYGYKTLIVWEHELKDLNRTKNRILNFHKTKLIKC